METRKIQVVGNRSFAVSLPKEWVLKNKLGPKDILFILENLNNELIITQNKQIQDSDKTISVNVETIDNLTEFIVFCYVKNVAHLKLYSTMNISYEKVKQIRTILNHLEGYDIVHENEKSIEIEFIITKITLSIQRILQRMTYLLTIMIDALKNNDSKTISDTEDSLDRLYHLSKRIAIACLNDSNLRMQNNILHKDDLFFYKDISKKLENIGDNLCRMEKLKSCKANFEDVEKLLLVIKVIVEKKESYTDIKKKLDLMKLNNSSECGMIVLRIKELTYDLIENFMSIEYNKKYFS